MQRPEIGDLSGITLLHSPDTLDYGPAITEFAPGSMTLEKILAFTAAERHVMDVARSLGAATVCVPHGEDPPVGDGVYWQNRSYFEAHRVRQELLARHCDGIPDMTRYSVTPDSGGAEAARAYMKAGGLLVLAYAALEAGHMKYLLDDPRQLDRFMAFAASDTAQEVPLGNFELRQFVPTPSNRYTSYRIVVDATGGLLAAGLYYSAHTKDAPQVITRDRFEDSRPNSLVRRMKTALEDPESDFYLGAKNVRSNSACGGKTIPLMGDNPKTLSSDERIILEAHNIDPDNPAPPQEHVGTARFLGRVVGRHTHLVQALDFVDKRFSEINFGPSGGTFATCQMGGGGTRLERYIAMRERALANLARTVRP